MFSLTIPADATPGSAPGKVAAAEFQGPATTRQMTLSKTPGDFDPATIIARSPGTSVTIMYVVGQNVQAGNTYYFNLRNQSSDIPVVCQPGELVNVIVNASPPQT